MHRRTAASTTSSKVSASRERRAKRVNTLNNGGGIRNVNGHLPHHSKHHSDDKNTGIGKRVLLLAIGVIFVCLLLIWGGAMYHVSTNSEDSRKTKVSPSKNAPTPRRMRNDKPKEEIVNEDIQSDPNQSPYTAEALVKNPHLGWQPPLVPSPLGSSFSWRTCFKADPKSDGTDQPAGCNENPSELGSAPAVEKDWVPDVTIIRKMMLASLLMKC